MISVSISAVTACTLGNAIFALGADSDLDKKSARVTRTATLDGGVYINHSGYTDGDRTLEIKSQITPNQEAVLNNIFKNHTSCLISFKDGLFLGVISYLSTKNGKLIMTYLIEQKES